MRSKAWRSASAAFSACRRWAGSMMASLGPTFGNWMMAMPSTPSPGASMHVDGLGEQPPVGGGVRLGVGVVPRPHHEDHLGMVLGDGPGQVGLEVRVVEEPPSRRTRGGSPPPRRSPAWPPGSRPRRRTSRCRRWSSPAADPTARGPGRREGRSEGAGDGGRRWARPPGTTDDPRPMAAGARRRRRAQEEGGHGDRGRQHHDAEERPPLPPVATERAARGGRSWPVAAARVAASRAASRRRRRARW